MSDPLIQTLKFENLSYSYEGGPQIFEDISFVFPMFKIVWFQSTGGKGRSSLLQILAGLLQATSGKYLINEKDVNEMTFEEFLPYRLKIGYGFDFGGLINNKTLLENLTLPLAYHKIMDYNGIQKRCLDYMDYLGVIQYKDQRPSVVPGSIRKLMCLLRAIIHHPDVLLLDDPSVGVNEKTMLKYFDLIRLIQGQGGLSHLYMSSFDTKMISFLGAEEVLIDNMQLIIPEKPLLQVANG